MNCFSFAGFGPYTVKLLGRNALDAKCQMEFLHHMSRKACPTLCNSADTGSNKNNFCISSALHNTQYDKIRFFFQYKIQSPTFEQKSHLYWQESPTYVHRARIFLAHSPLRDPRTGLTLVVRIQNLNIDVSGFSQRFLFENIELVNTSKPYSIMRFSAKLYHMILLQLLHLKKQEQVMVRNF